ncbi:hypothetical protein [Aquitalea sp. USM4]|uniref:hypothetical protein n=1 Tax=Aquitalea sp. USM4 TaxID=1590041 RepID=UPI00103D2DE3|nr:hypothetical protein [Aquitalea sp. USM4]QBJ80512.1 hypothetical protein DKK66_19885 [Aquitalea sp. USM4]
MEFKSLGELALHLASLQAQQVIELQHGLEVCAKKIEKTAKEEIGHYQSAVGPFPEWAELAESTEFDKASHGYPVDAPLLRTGEMRDSIGHEVHGLEAIIGAKDPKMVYHEFGTSKIPPRPVMGPALFRNKDFILRTIGKAAVTGLVGGQRIHPGLGYED